jgi:hypothetical protein
MFNEITRKTHKKLEMEYFVLKLTKVIDGHKVAQEILDNIDQDGLVTARFLAEVILNAEVS